MTHTCPEVSMKKDSEIKLHENSESDIVLNEIVNMKTY